MLQSHISQFYFFLYTQILTNALPGLTTVMLSWPLVIIHLGLLFAPAFRVTQETGSCVQVTPKFVNCACFKKRSTFFGKWLRHGIFAIFGSNGQSACVRFRKIRTGSFH